MVGVVPFDDADDLCFGCLVDLRDEVSLFPLLHFDRLDFPDTVLEVSSRLLGGFDGDVKHELPLDDQTLRLKDTKEDREKEGG